MSLLKSHAIAQYDRKGNPIKIYDNMNDVIKENPTFKGQPIRGVCDGSKKLLMDLFGDTLIQMELLKNKI